MKFLLMSTRGCQLSWLGNNPALSKIHPEHLNRRLYWTPQVPHRRARYRTWSGNGSISPREQSCLRCSKTLFTCRSLYRPELVFHSCNGKYGREGLGTTSGTEKERKGRMLPLRGSEARGAGTIASSSRSLIRAGNSPNLTNHNYNLVAKGCAS